VNLRTRIALTLAAVAFGVASLAALASYLGTASRLRSSIDDTLVSRAVAVNAEDFEGRDGRGDGDRGPGGDANGDCPLAGSFAPATAAQIVAEDGSASPCIDGAPALPAADAQTHLEPGDFDLRSVTIEGERYRVLSVRWHAGGTLQLARPFAETDDLLDRLRVELAALVGIGTVAAAGIGWLIATRLARPIVRLRDAAHGIATTLDLRAPIDVGGTGEVASLSESIATMIAALGRSQEQQRRLVADASHEMRTPLTSLRSNLELLSRIERLPVEERQEVVGQVLDDVDDLATLLEELVDLASDLAAAEPVEPVRLGDLARAAAARTQRRTGRAIDVDEEDGEEGPGRPRQLERAIANLIDNAVKYSEPGTPIEVRIEGRSVVVGDRGRGIPPDDLDRVFDRFYRAVEVRSDPGSGLGLAIVAEIVRAHGGSVVARNREGGGAEVGFTLDPV
jgi:two-component system sensor histidine kinase MprB